MWSFLSGKVLSNVQLSFVEQVPMITLNTMYSDLICFVTGFIGGEGTNDLRIEGQRRN